MKQTFAKKYQKNLDLLVTSLPLLRKAVLDNHLYFRDVETVTIALREYIKGIEYPSEKNELEHKKHSVNLFEGILRLSNKKKKMQLLKAMFDHPNPLMWSDFKGSMHPIKIAYQTQSEDVVPFLIKEGLDGAPSQHWYKFIDSVTELLLEGRDPHHPALVEYLFEEENYKFWTSVVETGFYAENADLAYLLTHVQNFNAPDNIQQNMTRAFLDASFVGLDKTQINPNPSFLSELKKLEEWGWFNRKEIDENINLDESEHHRYLREIFILLDRQDLNEHTPLTSTAKRGMRL
jgi:hypothetical protein